MVTRGSQCFTQALELAVSEIDRGAIAAGFRGMASRGETGGDYFTEGVAPYLLEFIANGPKAMTH